MPRGVSAQVAVQWFTRSLCGVTALDLSQCRLLDDACVTQLAQCCTRLSWLRLEELDLCTAPALCALVAANQSRLRHLSLRRSRCLQDASVLVTAIAGCKALT